MSERTFPPPWTVTDIDAAFKVTDANGQDLGFFYYEEERSRRDAAKMLTRDQARRLAIGFSKLPGLLKPS